MDVRIFTEPQQGATYDELAAVAKAAEQAGFSAFFRSDHFMAIGASKRAAAGVGPTDAWVTLAGIARETSTIRLGTLLSAGTFRHPGALAVAVAEVDQMSHGRVEFGLGAGWYEAEHRAFGLPFPATVGERLARLDEQLAIITGLWSAPGGSGFSFHGTYYDLTDNPALVGPFQQPGPPVVVGGRGRRTTPALAARYAAEWNLPFQTATDAAAIFESADPACEAIGRDPSTLVRSVALTTYSGPDRATIERRIAAVTDDAASIQPSALVGTPEEILERLAPYAAIGVSRVYLQVLDVTDLEHVAFLGETLIGPISEL